MAYTDFTWDNIEKKLGISNKKAIIFDKIAPIATSNALSETLKEAKEMRLSSEKARSEWIVVPILRELRKNNNNFFTIYSGDSLNVDTKKGLKGECDFILAKDIGTFDINYPIIQIVEAKKHDLDIGIPQCIAQLVGAKIFNEIKGVNLPKIYGCVTTGNDWIFMVLENNIIFIDTKIYYLNEIENILGVFQEIIDYYKELLK
jgi:hypothetical protein